MKTANNPLNKTVKKNPSYNLHSVYNFDTGFSIMGWLSMMETAELNGTVEVVKVKNNLSKRLDLLSK